MEIETRLTVAQIAAAYGETASSIYAEVGRGTLQGIESDGRNPGRAGKPRPFAEALQMGLFVHMRRSLPSNGDLGRRCQAVAAAVTAWFWEAVTGKRPGLGFLVVSSPPGGPESYALTQGPDDVLPMLRQAAETGARLEVLPLLPALQPLMVALARERFRGVGHVRAGRSGASADP